MAKVWILFSVANDYNQPDKAFEELFWEKPTQKYLMEKYGFNTEQAKEMRQSNVDGSGDFWVEEFNQPLED